METFHRIIIAVCFLGIAASLLGMIGVVCYGSITRLVKAARANIKATILLAPFIMVAVHVGATKPPPVTPSVKVTVSDIETTAHAVTFRLTVPEEAVGRQSFVQTKKKAIGAVWFDGYDPFTITDTNATYTVSGDFVGGKDDRLLRIVIQGGISTISEVP